jgi:aspartate kinase
MNALKSVAVLKFGGTSLATPESRETAIQRIRETRERGSAPVVVASAIGRAPQPYATDSLLSLANDTAPSANTDLLLACGELISASVFASLLEERGIPAIALTGGQAGIVTDESFGDAKIVRVEPQRVTALLERGIVPVVAGFQGASESGAITTLGRGGSDLSAIALGHALGAESVDIYTDVSGAMTADPRRIDGAHTIERASLEEMTELAEHGAKVMHHKAADYAHRMQMPYAIKGLDSGTGTVVDDAVRHDRAVTGVTATGRVTWIRAIRGDVEDRKRRMQVELQMFERLAQAGISIDQVTINQAGVMFVVAGDRGSEIRSLLADLNLAVRVREGCAKLSVVGAGMRGRPGVVLEIVNALSGENVEIIHCTDSNVTVSVLVPAEDARRAEQAVHDHFALGERGEETS